MENIKIAIVGWGNVGRGVYESIKRNQDMSLVGIITRRPSEIKKEFPSYCKFDMNVCDISSISSSNYSSPMSHTGDLWFLLHERADVAILCGGSKNDLPVQGPFFARHINTVDSFDTHKKIPKHFDDMNKVAEEYKNTSVISAGWDPGTFSLERVLADAFIPGVTPQGFYGFENGGLSMGHSEALRTIKGVKDARQYTHAIPETMDKLRNRAIPNLTAGDMHTRECYVVLENDTPAERERIEKEIINMDVYFKGYATTVKFTTRIGISDLDLTRGQAHDGVVIASGTTGNHNRALIEYKNKWDSNPEATGNILVACARACHRMHKEGKSGAYTMLDIPPAYYSQRTQEELLSKFM